MSRRWKLPFILSFNLLQGAAAPSPDCPQIAMPGQSFPAQLDLSGRPSGTSGLSGQSFAALPGLDAGNPCNSPLPGGAGRANTLRSESGQSESGDVLHGLPLPDILRPITDPHQRPEYR